MIFKLREINPEHFEVIICLYDESTNEKAYMKVCETTKEKTTHIIPPVEVFNINESELIENPDNVSPETHIFTRTALALILDQYKLMLIRAIENIPND